MKEIEYLNIINNTLKNNSYLGDDCAYLKDLGISVTQDSLIENVHFSLKTATPYEIGYKSVAVNLSDLASAGVLPKYILISLSLPNYADENFIKEFYRGVNKISEIFDIKVAGGDLTSANKIAISICAIGKNISKNTCSRKNAKIGDIIATTGTHGSSGLGLQLLQENKKEPEHIIKKHLMPYPKVNEGLEIAKISQSDFCMMDTSDGLGDVLYKLASASNLTFSVNYDEIPKDKELIDNPHLVFWGGEDFELVFTLDKNIFEKLDKNKFFKIGEVVQKIENIPVIIDYKDSQKYITKDIFEEKIYKHFEDK